MTISEKDIEIISRLLENPGDSEDAQKLKQSIAKSFDKFMAKQSQTVRKALGAEKVERLAKVYRLWQEKRLTNPEYRNELLLILPPHLAHHTWKHGRDGVLSNKEIIELRGPVEAAIDTLAKFIGVSKNTISNYRSDAVDIIMSSCGSELPD